MSVTALSKIAPKAKEPVYRTLAPIQSDKIAEDVYARAMTAPCVTITPQELLSLSPKVQLCIREVITPKRINEPVVATHALAAVETAIPPEPDLLPFVPDQLISTDPLETYLNSLSPSQIPSPFVVAKDSLSL